MSHGTLVDLLPWLLGLHAPLVVVVAVHSTVEPLRARRALMALLAAPVERSARDLVGSR